MGKIGIQGKIEYGKLGMCQSGIVVKGNRRENFSGNREIGIKIEEVGNRYMWDMPI